MPIKLIGRTTDFKGKPLWEILGNLKNHGVGRIVIRNRFQRYPEPSYMKILKVAALPPPPNPLKYEVSDSVSCIVMIFFLALCVLTRACFLSGS